ncbi:MAG: hypothetical protein ACE5NN_03685 [Candidatus Bathyarchaeia archaeon]
MNNRERTMAVFNRTKADRLVWQPRIHHWYEVNKVRGTLPEEYEGMSLLEIYDNLGASPRAYHYFNDTVKCSEGEKVELIVKEDESYIYQKYKTPKGSITQVERKTEYGTAALRVEYFLKSIEDFRVLAYVLRHQTFEFDKDLYGRMEKLIGDRSEPLVTIPWGSIQRFFIVYMGFQKGVIALWKHREEVEELLRVFDENDDKRLKVIKKAPFRIVNFGDNIDEGLCSPPLFKRYMLPYYRRRTEELHKAGKFCTSHWDGKVRLLLPFAGETGLDGLECIPPSPLGNITLEELKKGLEGMVLVDGIPATLFLPYVKDEVLESFVYRLLDLFAPYIIVGISDKLPANGDVEKVRMVGEIVRDYRI